MVTKTILGTTLKEFVVLAKANPTLLNFSR